MLWSSHSKLARQLQSGDRTEIKKAIAKLADHGDAEAIRILLESHGDHSLGPEGIESEVLLALGARGSRILPMLLVEVQNPSITARRRVAKLFAQLGPAPEAVPHLVNMLGDADRKVRKSSVCALARLGGDRAVELILSALKKGIIELDAETVEALANMGDQRAVPVLLEALKRPEFVLKYGTNGVKKAMRKLAWRPQNQVEREILQVASGKYESLLALGSSGVPYLACILGSALASSRKKIRAGEVLAKIRDVQAVEALSVGLKDNDKKVREFVLKSLALHSDPTGLQKVVEYCRNGGDWKQLRYQEVAMAVVRTDNPKVAPLIIALLGKLEVNKDTIHTVGLAILALGRMRHAKAFALLLARFNTSSEPRIIKSYAARALGSLGDRRAVDPLIDALSAVSNRASEKKAENTDIRDAVVAALVQLGDARAVPALCQLLESSKCDRDVGLIAKALGDLGDTSAAPALMKLHSRFRLLAAKALAKLDDPRAIEPILLHLESEKRLLEKGYWGDNNYQEVLDLCEEIKLVQTMGYKEAIPALLKICKETPRMYYDVERAMCAALFGLGYEPNTPNGQVEWFAKLREFGMHTEALQIAESSFRKSPQDQSVLFAVLDAYDTAIHILENNKYRDRADDTKLRALRNSGLMILECYYRVYPQGRNEIEVKQQLSQIRRH